MEAFFGNKVMRQSTVHGNKDLPGLPPQKLQEMKRVVKEVLKYSDCEFEDVWKLCEDAVGHACHT